MSLLDTLPFSILSFGNGQLIAFLPQGEEELRRVVVFAQAYPEIFRRFFPNVDIDSIAAGNYGVVDESQQSSDDSSSETTSPGAAAATSLPSEYDWDSDDIPNAVRPLLTATEKLIANFHATSAAINGQVLSFPQLVRTGQVRLHSSYRAALLARAAKDKKSTYTWDQRRTIPPSPQDLRGAELRSFLTSQGLPHYVPSSRLTEFKPRRSPSISRGSPSIKMVKGGKLLGRLTRDPSALDLAFSTAGTTVVPELNRMYMFEELYPEAEEMDENDDPAEWGSSPTRAGSSTWASSSSAGSPWPASQDTVYSFDI
ncbi:hypothetical protein EV122DRAFT_282009 [Schizophyllum commune]